MDNNTLQHHGILGMRWGIRRFRNRDGTLTPAGKRRADKKSANQETHEDYKKNHTSKNAGSMSNSELRDRINRLQMEKQYAQLTSNEKSTGFKVVNDIFVNSAKQTASNYVSQYMTKGVDVLIGKFIKKAK